jgi:hypothetical protein
MSSRSVTRRQQSFAHGGIRIAGIVTVDLNVMANFELDGKNPPPCISGAHVDLSNVIF